MERALEMAGGGLIDIWLIGILGEEPRSEALVEFGSLFLRDAAIRSLSDKRMGEPPPTRRFIFCVDEPATFQRQKPFVERLVGDVADSARTAATRNRLPSTAARSRIVRAA